MKPLTGLGLSLVAQTVPPTRKAEYCEAQNLDVGGGEPDWGLLPSLDPSRAPLFVPAPLESFVGEPEELQSLQQQNNMLGRHIQELEHAKSLAAAQSVQALHKIRARQEQVKKEAASAVRRAKELQQDLEEQHRPFVLEIGFMRQKEVPQTDASLPRLESLTEDTARGPRPPASFGGPALPTLPLDGGLHVDSAAGQAPTRRLLEERGPPVPSATESMVTTPSVTTAKTQATRQSVPMEVALLPDGQPYVDAMGNPLGPLKKLELPNIKDEPPVEYTSMLLQSGGLRPAHPYLSSSQTHGIAPPPLETTGSFSEQEVVFASGLLEGGEFAPFEEVPPPSYVTPTGACTNPQMFAELNSMLPSSSVFSAGTPSGIDNTDGVVADRDPPAAETGGLLAKSNEPSYPETLTETQVGSPSATLRSSISTAGGATPSRPKQESRPKQDSAAGTATRGGSTPSRPKQESRPKPETGGGTATRGGSTPSAERDKTTLAGAMERRGSSRRRSSEEAAADKRASLNPPPSEQLQAELDECLDTIKWCAASVTRESLQDLKNLTRPPAAVKVVLETVAMLIGITDLRWDRLKKTVCAREFPEKLQKLNFQQNVSRDMFRKLRERLAHAEFDEELLKSVSVPVVPLATWCRAIGVHLSRTKYRGGPPVRPLFSAGGSSVMTTVAAHAGDGDAANVEQLEPVESQSGPMVDILIHPDINKMSPDELRQVPNLTISRPGIGQITFPGETDCSNLDFQSIVRLEVGEVLVYPDSSTKPPLGEGLNKPATVVMFQCYPPSGSKMMHDASAQERYKKQIKDMTEEKSAHFIDYDCLTGVWTFSVEHF